MVARERRPGQKKNGLAARKPMVIKRRRELRRQGQFSCKQCKTIHPLADLCKCCGACPKCCVCNARKSLAILG